MSNEGVINQEHKDYIGNAITLDEIISWHNEIVKDWSEPEYCIFNLFEVSKYKGENKAPTRN